MTLDAVVAYTERQRADAGDVASAAWLVGNACIGTPVATKPYDTEAGTIEAVGMVTFHPSGVLRWRGCTLFLTDDEAARASFVESFMVLLDARSENQ